MVVELQCDTTIRGCLASCDDSLNLQLERVSVKNIDGKVRTAEFIYVRGTRVRCVHVPSNLTPQEAVAKDAKRRAAALHRAAAQAVTERQAKGEATGGSASLSS